MDTRHRLLTALALGLVVVLSTASAGAFALSAAADGSAILGHPTQSASDQSPETAQRQRASGASGQSPVPCSWEEDSLTTPIWWDTPPQSGSVMTLSTGKTFIEPGHNDEVRIIIQMRAEPVATFKSRLRASASQLSITQRDRVLAYEAEARASHQHLLKEMAAQSIEMQLTRQYTYIFNGLAGAIKRADMERIDALPAVRRVFPDYQVHAMLDESVPLIGAPDVWAMIDARGHPVTGAGVRVAIIDSGIDYTHSDLGGCFGQGCKVVDGWDFINDDADPMDDNGHGTHCAGIVAADGAVKGVAPDAILYAYKALDSNLHASGSSVMAAIERATDPDSDPTTDDAVDVISMSLGRSLSASLDDALAIATDAAVDQGIVVVVAAGNEGPGYQTITSPGVARKAMTVGAVWKSDSIAGFSSRGPVPDYPEIVKPDLLAPGVNIQSTHLAGGHRSQGGTSAATPHVAGCVALIKQLHPTWSPEMIKANLMNTAKPLALDVYTEGAGRVRVDHAARAQAVLTPGSLGLGLVSEDQRLWTRTEALRITNVSTTVVTYSLAVSGTLPGGVETTLDPDAVVLGAGESTSVTFRITVDNSATAYTHEEPWSYEGRVIARPVMQESTYLGSEGEPLVVPFTFTRAAGLVMALDPTRWLVVVHNGEDVWQRECPSPLGCTEPTLLLPPGTYDLWVVYFRGEAWVIREGMVISGLTSLTIGASDAVHTITFAPRDVNGLSMTGEHAVVAQQFTHLPSGISAGVFGWRPPLARRFSRVSQEYMWQWRLDVPWMNSWYELNGRLIGVSADMTLENEASAYRHLVYQFHPESSRAELQVAHYFTERPYG